MLGSCDLMMLRKYLTAFFTMASLGFAQMDLPWTVTNLQREKPGVRAEGSTAQQPRPAPAGPADVTRVSRKSGASGSASVTRGLVPSRQPGAGGETTSAVAAHVTWGCPVSLRASVFPLVNEEGGPQAWALGHCSVGYRGRAWVTGDTKATRPSLPPRGPSESSKSSLSHAQLPGLGGGAYTKAALGHSSEVRYHRTTLRTGMAPLKYSTQHSRPTWIPRAARKKREQV